MSSSWEHFLEPVIAIAKRAGQAVMPVYRQATLTVTEKSDRTPVTEADFIAHRIISENLVTLSPHFPVLSEEAADIDYAVRQLWKTYWLVDPLDGTKEFIEKNGEFTVNIALIHDSTVVLGVVYAPVLDVCYFACQGKSAYKQEQAKPPEVIHAARWLGPAIRAVGSRRHSRERLERLLQHFPSLQFKPMGSSLKSCVIAEGGADFYLRLGPTSEWDTAAAQCVVEAAGGQIIDVQGRRLRYNTKESLLNPWFLVCGDPTVDWLSRLRPVLEQ